MVALPTTGARAQPCVPGFDPPPATPDGAVVALLDDGPSGGLVLGGSFTTVGVTAASNIARFDGAGFMPIGPGFDAGVNALTIHAGDLIAAGNFTTDGVQVLARIARWTGAAWAPLGSGLNSSVLALTSANLGAGPGLYAAGQFTSAGGAPAVGVARWSGSSWSALANGLVGGARVGLALAAHDDGRGPALFVGGSFLGAGTTPSANIARWDGAAWSAVGAGLAGPVRAIAVYDGRLIAGGDFTAVSGGGPASRLAVWDGSVWAEFAGGANGPVRTLLALPDPAGPGLLVAGGEFTQIGGVPAARVAIYDGSAWSALGPGSASMVRALARHGDSLYIGADALTPVGSPAASLTRWTLCQAGLIGDLNNDGRVDGADITVILSNWGQTGVAGDTNNDGVIDGADITVVLNNFNG
ncbi:MAG: hypothetical protein D6693_05580 [Planctomycetota bacterium]|nr:MAG: hypothetical protein D6693_05580 [Planctomycetota bacterium]